MANQLICCLIKGSKKPRAPTFSFQGSALPWKEKNVLLIIKKKY
jgi:hypothetical protein